MSKESDLIQAGGEAMVCDCGRKHGFVYGRRAYLSEPQVMCSCPVTIRCPGGICQTTWYGQDITKEGKTDGAD